MAKRATLPKRSQFIRDQFAGNSAATPKTIIAAWKAAGGVAAISPSLVYMVKTTINRSQSRKSEAKKRILPTSVRGVKGPSAPAAPVNAYEAIEAGLDEMLRESLHAGDSRLSDLLRSARRSVSTRLIG